MSFNQTSNSQTYNDGLQQPQQTYNGHTMYGNLQNQTGLQQPYSMQPQQTAQTSNANRHYLGQYQQQQQPQRQPVLDSYSSQNAQVKQQAHVSRGHNYQHSYSLQNNAPLTSNGMLSERGMQSRQGVNSRTNSNSSYQTEANSHSMNTHKSWQSSGRNPPSAYGQPTAQSYQPTATPAYGQAPNPLGPSATSIGSNKISAKSFQTQHESYLTTPGIASYQQTGNPQSSTNNGMFQQNNHTHTANNYNNIGNQPNQQPSSARIEQEIQSYGGYNQPETNVSNAPIVQTVTDFDQRRNSVAPPAQQQQPAGHQTVQSNEGLGVDARTQSEPPNVQAAKAAETVQGAPDSADGRRALLESALRCDLPKFLIESVLENPNLPKVKDPASVKVHSVELLKLLMQEPGYGLKFKIVLEAIPAWKKYASQDHSLFITGLEQKADYFLTDGNSSMDTKKLLTEG